MTKFLPAFITTTAMLFTFVASPAIAIEDCAQAAKLSEEANALSDKKPAIAANKLREAIAYCGKSAALHYNLATTLYQQEIFSEAEASLRTALDINPNYSKAVNALAFLMYTQGGDKRKAKILADMAVMLEPNNQTYRNTLDLINENIDNPAQVKFKRPDGIAIVIGNKNYANALLPAVKYADRDAAVMKKYLMNSLGFEEDNIILIKDATHLDFVKHFGDSGDHKGILYKRTHENRSDIFIFYSGHGAPDTNTKKPYLVPNDGDPNVIKLTGYSLDTLYDNLAKLNREKSPRSITVVLDSCFSGGSNDGMLIQNASPIYVEASTPVLAMRNAAVITSSKGNQISSWFPAKNHGLFTYYFLKTLKVAAEEGRKLSVGDIEKALLDVDGVNDRAWKLHNREQEPQVVGNKNIILVQ